jgi:hypothetical protein
LKMTALPESVTIENDSIA